MTPTLFQQVLGAPYYTLPDSVRALHAIRGEGRYAGRVTVTRGRGLLARLCAAAARLPRAMSDAPLTVTFLADARGERWRRDFAGARMHSRLWRGRHGLEERLGLLRLRFALHVDAGVLYWNVTGVRVLGLLPLPRAWFEGVYCQERERDGRYAFLVEAALPLAGPLIRYEGWLEPA